MRSGTRTGALVVLAVVVTCVLAIGASADPRAALVIPAALALVLVIRYSWARAAFFVFGAFLVFQTSSGLSAPKLFYFAVVGVSVLVSLTKLRGLSESTALRSLFPAYVGGIGIILWQVLIVLPYSVAVQGASLSNWLRDGATYILIGCAVIIALDAIGTTSVRTSRILVILVGALAAYSFAARWIAARGLVSAQPVDGDAALLSSLTALTLAVSFSFAMALAGSRINWAWFAAGVAFVFAVLVTGTRTGVVFAAVLIGIVGARSKRRAPVRRIVTAAVVGLAAIAAAVPLTAQFFQNEDFLAQRFASIWQTIQNGVGSDQSGAIRSRAYEYCLSLWQQNPLMGRGEGQTFVNPTTGVAGTDFSVDSPLVYLAKFGIIGCIILLTCLVLIFVPLLRRAPMFDWTLANTAVRGCVAILVALLPFGASLEDKGFAITVGLAVLLVGAALAEQTPEVSGLLPRSKTSKSSLREKRKSGHGEREATTVAAARRA